MKSRHLIQFLSLVVAATVLGGVSGTTASASYPILKLDLGRGHDPAEIQAGFTAFAIGDSGTVVDNIKLEIAPMISGEAIQSRWRWGPTGVPYEQLYRDFIFTVNGGISITLSGLNANETYEITIWSVDPVGSSGRKYVDWLANGDYCLSTDWTGGNTTVEAEDSFAFSGNATADGTGKIVLDATPNPLTDSQTQYYAFVNALMVSSLTPLTTARHPVPVDGATVTSIAVELQWEPGMLSSSSNVYFGEDRDRVANATIADPEFRGNMTDVSFLVGSAGSPYPDGLAANTTYYWRIDEVNELRADGLWAGEVWSFKVASLSATEPQPMSGSLFADPNGALTWTPGAGAVRHHVYLGTSLQDVQAGAAAADKGEVTEASYTTGMLELDKTYYWRVDEIDATTTHPGEIWSFTTILPGMGTVTMDFWENVAGDHQLFNLLDDPRYPDSPTSSEALTEFGTVDGVGDGYGAQISGWLYCPVTGEYTFWFTSGGQGELWLSTDDDPASAVLLCAESTWGTYNSFSIKSGPISLVAGQKYYIMARWKDFNAWDHCQVAWRGAGVPTQQIIAGHYLSPFEPVTAYGASPGNGAANIEVTRILRWKSGSFASQHRVFFGTDPNAVRDAGTSSPEYKGTKPKGTESYDPGTLQMETTYYWRIDEVNSVNPAGPWTGEVWSFTTGNFLVVDDFESYNDINTDEEGSNRIYMAWIDGYDTPEINGAVVGYPDTDNPGGHFVEVINVHGGLQSMPYFYDNDKKYSEAVKSLVGSDRDWTREGVDTLSLWFRGYSATVGSFVEEPVGTYTMTGSGTDITGTADEFHFAYKKLTGAGTIVAKVQSVTDTDAWAKAAVMIRETLDPGSEHVMGCVTPRSGVASEGRITANDVSFTFAQTGLRAPYWVKLERNAVGNFSMTASADGVTWAPVETGPSQPVWMDSPTVYIGLAVTAHNATATCTAVFTDVTIEGDTSQQPQWLDQDIGIMSNEVEPMYVALNGTAVVYNEDPNAVLTDQWTEWQIALQDFAAKGVTLTNVDSIAIGVGTQGNTTVEGGSGTLYIDDIRLYRPAAGQ